MDAPSSDANRRLHNRIRRHIFDRHSLTHSTLTHSLAVSVAARVIDASANPLEALTVFVASRRQELDCIFVLRDASRVSEHSPSSHLRAPVHSFLSLDIGPCASDSSLANPCTPAVLLRLLSTQQTCCQSSDTLILFPRFTPLSLLSFPLATHLPPLLLFYSLALFYLNNPANHDFE